MDDRNSVLLQLSLGTNPGKHQDLRRTIHSGRKKNLAARDRVDLAVLFVADALGFLSGELDRMHLSFGDNRQVRPFSNRIEIGDGGRSEEHTSELPSRVDISY